MIVELLGSGIKSQQISAEYGLNFFYYEKFNNRIPSIITKLCIFASVSFIAYQSFS